METTTPNTYNTRSWVWVCTPESTDNEVVSILACVDTLIVCGLSLWIAFQYDIWLHIGIGALIAPLLLLRTPYSTEKGINWLDQILTKVIDIVEELEGKLTSSNRSKFTQSTLKIISNILLMSTYLVLFVIIGLLSISTRIFATITGLLKHPIITITNIPTNWKRVALYTDFLHPLEIIPGLEAKIAAWKRYKYDFSYHPEIIPVFEVKTLDQFLFSEYFDRIVWEKLKRGNIIDRTISLSALFSILFVYVPVLIYRWSLKSTSVVYVPLIYLSQLSYKPNAPKQRAKQILKQKFQLVWAIGGAIICLTLLPILLATFTNWLANYTIEGSWTRAIINFFTFVPVMERWNVVRLACAIITVLMFVIAKKFIDATQSSSNHNSPVSTFIIDLTDFSLRTLNLIRGIGVLYIITCTLIIFWSKIRDIDWILPTIGQDWFPRLN